MFNKKYETCPRCRGYNVERQWCDRCKGEGRVEIKGESTCDTIEAESEQECYHEE
jgi:DnaJ-class molecular chaperone